MALVYVQGLLKTEAVTAAAFKKVNAEFGGKLKISTPYGAWRSWAMQNKLHTLFMKGLGPTAALPGHSNHESGYALDIWNWASFPTLPTVMKKHGFILDVPGEKWHYHFVGTPHAVTDAAARPLVRPVLHLGSKGAWVGILQRALGIKADNIFGQATLAAVKAFQTKHKLTADGVVGLSTWGKLASLKKI
jgi:hypothetical protein